VPGSGSSPGVLDQFGPAETLANYDLIEWFAVQPYSDGNIGQQGASYAGHTTNTETDRYWPCNRGERTDWSRRLKMSGSRCRS
jgi:hypothetical protein